VCGENKERKGELDRAKVKQGRPLYLRRLRCPSGGLVVRVLRRDPLRRIPLRLIPVALLPQRLAPVPHRLLRSPQDPFQLVHPHVNTLAVAFLPFSKRYPRAHTRSPNAKALSFAPYQCCQSFRRSKRRRKGEDETFAHLEGGESRRCKRGNGRSRWGDFDNAKGCKGKPCSYTDALLLRIQSWCCCCCRQERMNDFGSGAEDSGSAKNAFSLDSEVDLESEEDEEGGEVR
jgi:hypothetical protein